MDMQDDGVRSHSRETNPLLDFSCRDDSDQSGNVTVFTVASGLFVGLLVLGMIIYETGMLPVYTFSTCC